jgi:hypothetical protein
LSPGIIARESLLAEKVLEAEKASSKKQATIGPENGESLEKLSKIPEKAIDGYPPDRRESKWPGKLVHKGHRPKFASANAFTHQRDSRTKRYLDCNTS